MTPPSLCTSYADNRTDPYFWTRGDIAGVRSDFSDPDHPPASQRVYAQEHGIPRSTLGDWLRDSGPTDLHPDLVCFFRSAAGEAFLHRLVHAAFLAFRHHGPCGLRSISLFLQLSQLDRFVASSYGALHSLDDKLQSNLIAFRDEQQPGLVKHMPNKTITVVPDENFHGQHICLVAIEPVSNFILVEQYAQGRDATTWKQAIGQATQDWPVEIVQLTSDQSTALICCAQQQLQVQHSPDLLHRQRDLLQPLLLPLQRPINKAQKDLEKAKEKIAYLDEVHRADQAGDPDAAKIDYFEPMIEQIRKEMRASQQIKHSQERLDRVVEQVRGIGDDYRPFDYHQGQPVTAEQVAERLQERLGKIEEVVEQAGLGERAAQEVVKARKWTGLLVACVAWFWAVANQRVEELELSEEGERQLKECLIAGHYWQAAAGKGRDAQQRQRLAEMGKGLLKKAWAPGGALAGLDQEQKDKVQRVGQECALLFQRSSSCVEGRNGRLSLFHHGQGKLSSKRLQSLTVVHNYLVKRGDGTTAAQRLFEAKPPDLFDWLLKRMPDLPRPAAKRSNLHQNSVPDAA
jgi:Family of unknown function (DUF6399)